MQDKIIYIHYGSKKFDIRRFKPIQNKLYRTKPIGGLWASRIDAKFGWKDWNEIEDFKKCDPDNSFSFIFEDESKIFKIDDVEKIKKLPLISIRDSFSFEEGLEEYHIDFENCLKIGIDAIELIGKINSALYYGLYGWDCESIVVLNPNSIIPIQDANPKVYIL